MIRRIKTFLTDEKGYSAMQYGLILGSIVATATAAVVLLGAH
ncbi:MAG: hypothetical protein WCP73_10750 [Eubacteriales bacterium]